MSLYEEHTRPPPPQKKKTYSKFVNVHTPKNVTFIHYKAIIGQQSSTLTPDIFVAVVVFLFPQKENQKNLKLE